jgi:acetolactate synthase I/II/III large subunit
MIGAECLLRTLLDNSIDLCLMNPGTSEMQFVSALDRVPAMRGVLCLFEGVVSGAADGYARMSGKPAATLLHLGPGLANGLANFHNARKARTPIVSIVGEHSTRHLPHNAPLTTNIEQLARPVSEWVRTLDSAGRMGEAARDAVAAAIEPPGQVATLIVPADYSWSEAGLPGAPVSRPARKLPDGRRIREMAAILRASRSTALLLGGAALLDPALAAAARLAASTGARVFADRFAARMQRGAGRFAPEKIPYFPEPALAALSGIEDMILVEAYPPVSFFGYPSLPSEMAPPDCRMHVLAAPEEDGTGALEALADECGAHPAHRTTAIARPELPRDTALTAASIGRTVAALMREHAIVSDEMVSSSESVWRELNAAPPYDYLAVSGGSIGQGLPAALGAALACPDRKVIALEADGSGMYTLQALWTMARENLDVVTVIFANRSYRILDIELRRTGAAEAGPRAASMMDIGRPDLDWVALARGHGVEATRATTSNDFIAQFGAAMRERGPRLIEAVLAAE